MKQLTSIVLVVAFLVVSSNYVIGQEFPVTPDPADCTIVAPEEADLYQTVAEEFEPGGTHQESPDPPDEVDVENAIATVLMSVSCTNANKQLANLSLFTDRYLADRFSTPEGADELGHLIAASTRDAAPAETEDQLAVDSIDEAVLYDDGRIGLFVQTSNATEIFQDIVVLAEVEGAWLIDEVLIGDETTLKATPEASSHTGKKPVG